MSKGRFGIHGGQYVPETLMTAVHEVEEAYDYYKKDAEFMNAYKGEYMSQYEWAAYNKKYLNDIHKRWKKENK